MFHTSILNSTIHKLLVKLDDDLAKAALKQGCLFCGSKLHRADYPRSPRGLSKSDCDYYQFRRSACCSQCRRRNTSQSVRFFGRRWYVMPIFVLINALSGGWSYRRRAQMIKYHFDITVSERTWRRWRHWWRDCFEVTDFWKQAKGQIHINYLTGPFPRRLLSLYRESWTNRLVLLLQFFAPLTAGVFRAV